MCRGAASKGGRGWRQRDKYYGQNQSSNIILQFIGLVNPGLKTSKPSALLIALITEVKDYNNQSSKQRQKVQCPAQHGDVTRMQETRMSCQMTMVEI